MFKYIQFLLLISCMTACKDRARFDARSWRTTDCIEDSYAGDTYREYVVDDLIEHILPGMSRDSILVLLGTENGSSDSTVVYCLGPQSPLGVDFHWLTIYFDSAGIYMEAIIRHD